MNDKCSCEFSHPNRTWTHCTKCDRPIQKGWANKPSTKEAVVKHYFRGENALCGRQKFNKVLDLTDGKKTLEEVKNGFCLSCIKKQL